MMYVPVLLSVAIVEELELIWVCCGWRVDLFCFHLVADVKKNNKFKNIPTNICNHITTKLTTHRCILIDYFNKSNFSKHE
jgi:hypothetical protein